MSRLFAAFLLIVVLAIGGSAIAATAYQAGVTTGATQVVTDGTTVVTPIVVPAWGFHPGFGFGFLGFLGTIVFLILVFGLFRAIIGGGRHRHGWGPGGPDWGPNGGPGGPGGPGPDRWGGRERFRGTFEEWHRESHATSGADHGTPSGTPPGSTSSTGTTTPPATPA